jgi:hypothetical protein
MQSGTQLTHELVSIAVQGYPPINQTEGVTYLRAILSWFSSIDILGKPANKIFALEVIPNGIFLVRKCSVLAAKNVYGPKAPGGELSQTGIATVFRLAPVQNFDTEKPMRAENSRE